MNERLYRSRDERMIAGVAGGVAERFDVDPSLVRVLWVVLVFLSGGIFLLLYIAMAVLVPEAPVGERPVAHLGHRHRAPGGRRARLGRAGVRDPGVRREPATRIGGTRRDGPSAPVARDTGPRESAPETSAPWPDPAAGPDPSRGPTSRRPRRHRRRGAGRPDRATGDITAAGAVVAGSSPASSWSSSAAISCCAPSSRRST